ncbi:MAG TPA: RusA family crossover junction endodeoxyribonuclease [Phycisphaerae bacterium]|nr:RusA family crossover junction endodeoxyribonuclease [Phycisphaerae bacterium]
MTKMNPIRIEFFVPGVTDKRGVARPMPGGSKSAFYNKNLGRAMVVDACKHSKKWRNQVVLFAHQAHEGPLLTGPVLLSVKFLLPRPKGHYGTGKRAEVLKASAPQYPLKKPDLTKLTRAAEDALTGVLWVDDAQIVSQVVSKRYIDNASIPTGADFLVEEFVP